MYGFHGCGNRQPNIQPLPESGLVVPTMEEQFNKIDERYRAQQEHRQQMEQEHQQHRQFSSFDEARMKMHGEGGHGHQGGHGMYGRHGM